jgi:hypothetical protein
LPVKGDDAAFEPLARSAESSACALLAKVVMPDQSEFPSTMYEHGQMCFVVSVGSSDADVESESGPADGGKPAAGTRQDVLVAVYEEPRGLALEDLAKNPPAALASIDHFGRIDPAASEWRVGVRGDYAGWLAVRAKNRSGEVRLAGVPWSTCALWRLGRQVQQGGGAVASSTPRPEVCLGR